MEKTRLPFQLNIQVASVHTVHCQCDLVADNRRLSKFEMPLMEIDAEQLSIPDTSYSVNVSMPSAEFSRIIRDLSSIGDSSIHVI